MEFNDNILRSRLDRSVNFLTKSSDSGLWEARYVRRVSEYFIAYLSSHTGCRQACRFCHLTATGQTMFTAANLDEYLAQLDSVLEYYEQVKEEQGAASRVNVNFMARGEALANPVILDNLEGLAASMRERTERLGLAVKLNVSSILPKTIVDRALADILGKTSEAMLYYSLYSMDTKFRRRWLPTALSAELGLRKVAEYQQAVGKLVTLHWAFIEGENDDEKTIDEIIGAVNRIGIKAKFNLVRYNPYSELQGKESAENVIERNFKLIADALGHPSSRIVPRVGFDVAASCGMFVESAGSKRPARSGRDLATVEQTAE